MAYSKKENKMIYIVMTKGDFLQFHPKVVSNFIDNQAIMYILEIAIAVIYVALEAVFILKMEEVGDL